MTISKTIKPFITLGWYTVPMKGKLIRDKDGKKTLPELPKGWRETYSQEFNTRETSLGGAFTGEKSGIVALDCDNTLTYNLFKSLDPDYKFHFVSNGKRDKDGRLLNCGTIIYKYSPDLPTRYVKRDDGIDLDYYNDDGFIYLPGADNETKYPFEVCDLKPMPDTVKAALIALRPQRRISAEDARTQQSTYTIQLYPQLQVFLATKKVNVNLFRLLTPKAFRDMDAYQTKGYLHPNDVPEGQGSTYLSQVSAILGADCSVDVDTYLSSMKLINELFDRPMPNPRLYATVLERMVEGEAKIDGEPIWQYDEHWQEAKLQYITKRDDVLDCFFDDNRLMYYATNLSTHRVQAFNRDGELFSYLATTCQNPPSKKGILSMSLPLVTAVNTPTQNFGFYNDNGEVLFNIFSPTRALEVFKHPASYEKVYKEPLATLRYLKSLIPDTFMRNYVLGFIKRKLTYFEYSPVVLFFLGVNGSGKDTFVEILEKLLGENAIARPKVKEFLEKHNGWLLDKYFVQLDEYGNQLTKFSDREEALGLLKYYSGKSQVQIRRMATDGYTYNHSATFISTANRNPLMPDDGDRRLAVLDTPNKLADQPWVIANGGVKSTHDEIMSEVVDFAYYLATEVSMLDDSDYMEPPETRSKLMLIANSFAAGPRIAYMLKNKLFNELKLLAEEHDCYNVFNKSDTGRILENDLLELYVEMTGGNGQKRGLTQVMRNFPKRATTVGVEGSTRRDKTWYYEIDGLCGHNFARSDDDDKYVNLGSSTLGALEDDEL